MGELAGAGRPQLLLVDDDEAVRDILAALAEYLGFEALVARNGREALTLTVRHQHQLRAAVIDDHMPGWSGIETCQHIRRALPGLPIALTSGYVGGIERLESGAQLLLEKPFGLRTLAEALRRLGVTADSAAA